MMSSWVCRSPISSILGARYGEISVAFAVAIAVFCSALAWCGVHLDPRDVGASGCTVSAARHEIDVAYLVNTAQVEIIDFQLYDDPLRIKLEPTLIVERYLRHH